MQSATSVANPYLDLMIELHGGAEPNGFLRVMREGVFDRERFHRFVDALMRRYEVIDQYGFAVPTPEALAAVAEHGPILEIGAGCGYWAHLLRQMGVDVLAFDKYPPPHAPPEVGYRWKTTFTPVAFGDELIAAQYPERTLLLVWPTLGDRWADHALAAYRGNTLLYVGEHGGCAADKWFHGRLNAEWVREARAPVYQWPGVHDALYIYRRK